MRQRRDDVLDHSIGKVFLFRVTAHVDEWQNSNGGFVGEREDGCGRPACRNVDKARPIRMHRTSYIFQLLVPDVFERDVELPETCRKTSSDTQMPPGSAMPSSLAAIFTPSPSMSSPSISTSPKLMPMRNSMRTSSGTSLLRSLMRFWTTTAQSTAATIDGNSRSTPSPVVLTILPP